MLTVLKAISHVLLNLKILVLGLCGVFWFVGERTGSRAGIHRNDCAVPGVFVSSVVPSPTLGRGFTAQPWAPLFANAAWQYWQHHS